MSSFPTVQNTPPSSLNATSDGSRQLPRYGAPMPNNYSLITTDSASVQETTQSNVNVLSNREGSTNKSLDSSSTTAIPVKYPDFKSKSSRKRSFRNWPERIKQSPDRMADAGFYYTQNSDSVRCFHCGIGLRNWEQDDDPWVEHARWFKNCPFVKSKKGQTFIDRVQEAVRQHELQQALRENNLQANIPDLTPDCPPPSADNIRSTSSALVSQRSAEFPSDVERKNPLLCDAAQSVLSMGYLPKIVKMAVDEILKLEGWSGMTGEAILKIILDKEENGELDKNRLMIPSFRSQNSVNKAGKTDQKSVENNIKIKTENQEMKDRMVCKLCCEKQVSIVLLPCGHLVSCAQCAPALKQCPVCRSQTKATVRVMLT